MNRLSGAEAFVRMLQQHGLHVGTRAPRRSCASCSGTDQACLRPLRRAFTPGQHARIAEAYGVKAWRVETPPISGRRSRRPSRSTRQTLIDVVTQPLHEARGPVSEWVA